MAEEAGNVGGALWDEALGRRPEPAGRYSSVDEMDRKPRTMEAMVEEAEEYKRILEEI